MSWQTGDDPVAGDRASCDAIDLVIAPRVRDLGDGFTVRRALPHGRRQMVGPFIFFDQMGPVQFVSGAGLDVRPHPHIGLATVTYLFDGRIAHRDSEGNRLEITPGAMNLMTAGRGIVHSERSPAEVRRAGAGLSGIQSWIALPEQYEEIAPSFQHFEAGVLPVIQDNGVWARIIAGSLFGASAPVEMLSPWFYAEVRLDAGSVVPFDAVYEERAIYLVDGSVTIDGTAFEGPQLLVLREGVRPTIRAASSARLMLLGGAALEGPRYLWWNFVSSRRERIADAKEDWAQGRFAPVPGETEFIPLPLG